jgi:hypothetical protein
MLCRKQRFASIQWCVVGKWLKTLIATLRICSAADAALVDGSADCFFGPLQNGLNLIHFTS